MDVSVSAGIKQVRPDFEGGSWRTDAFPKECTLRSCDFSITGATVKEVAFSGAFSGAMPQAHHVCRCGLCLWCVACTLHVDM